MLWSRFFYTASLLLGVLLGWPVLVLWAVWVPKIRAGFWQKLGFYSNEQRERLANFADYKVTNPAVKTYWFHAVSVGELNALRPLLRRCLENNNTQIVISATTKTGYALALSTFAKTDNVVVIYCPFDFPWVISAALSAIQPDLLVIAETELWPNLIALTAKQCPVVVANGRLSENSFQGYRRWLGWLVKAMLQQVSVVLAQSEEDGERYQALGAMNIQVTGNMKLDIPTVVSLEKLVALQQTLGLDDSKSPKHPVLVLASTQPGEEIGFLPLINQVCDQGGRVLLVPRHPERADEVVALCRQGIGQPIAKRAQHNANNPTNASVVVVDTVGELSALYHLATVAVIGGSFLPKRGGQNPLEALAAGAPVVFGPSMRNFRAIVQLIRDYEAGLQASSMEEATQAVQLLLNNPEQRQPFSANGKQLLADHAGATEDTYQQLQQLHYN